VRPEDEENLALLRDHLQRHSAVVYFNHLFLGNGPLVIALLLDHPGDFIRVISAVEYTERIRWLRKFVRAAEEILGQPGGILDIAPEGTRSPDGALQKAQSGIAEASKVS